MKPARALARLSLMLAVTGSLACNGERQTPPTVPSPSAPEPQTTKAAAPAPAVIQWALGSDSRGDYPDTADAYLLLLPKEQKDKQKPLEGGTRVTPACVRATGILPGPATIRWLFLLIDGALHVMKQPDLPGGKPEPILTEKDAKAPRVTRLLGYRADTSATAPLQILTAVLPEGAVEEQIWSFTLAGTKTDAKATIKRAAPATEDSALASKEAFFRAYQSPRCLPGGLDCVTIGDDKKSRFIEVEPTRGAPRKELIPLGGARVQDIAWSSDDASSLYVLAQCEAPPAPQSSSK